MKHVVLLGVLLILFVLVSFIERGVIPTYTKNAQSLTARKEQVIPTPIATTFPTVSPSPSKYLSISPVLSPSPKTITLDQTIFDLKYPSSIQVGTGENSISLESTDAPTTITNWYKEKIKSLGMSAKSFVQTNTNGNILNKLVGTDGRYQVRVEIGRHNNESIVHVSVSLVPLDKRESI